MELLSGFSLLLQQINALLKKNFILDWRNRRSIFLQLFSSFFFIVFMFALRKTNKCTQSRPNFSAKVCDPKPITNSPIPACKDELIINVPCFDFVWSGSGNQRLEFIVNGIMTNNPGHTILRVKSFRTKDELDKWLLYNPMRCPGALHLFETNAKEIRYGICGGANPLEPRVSSNMVICQFGYIGRQFAYGCRVPTGWACGLRLPNFRSQPTEP
ncbi:unnamed protein product [Coffea canephora]|uniref:Uncharacterized protein n=1 Tax=Coffea canephora TaxID=49390 RepID=A0A068V4N7_COFCA|nr:unnamed protein product [Coffea canephora]